MVRSFMIGVLLVGGCLLPNPAYDDAGASASASESGGSLGATMTVSAGETGTGGVTGGVTTGGDGSGTGGSSGGACVPEASESCYSGAAGTEGVGPCKAGMRTCEPSGLWGACVGEVTPTKELCGDGIDQDCNAVIDDAADCATDLECPMLPGLVACYGFPDGVTDVLRDDSGNMHHGVMSGVSLVSSLQGKGKAGEFMGSSVASVDEHPDLSPAFFTVTLLMRPGMGPMEAGLVDKEGQFGVFYHASGMVDCTVVTDAMTFNEAKSPVPPDKWSMVACAFDGKDVTVSVYAGAPVSPVPVPLAGKVAAPDGNGMRVGSNAPNGDQPFAGALDRVLLFDRALTSDELCMLAGPLCG